MFSTVRGPPVVLSLKEHIPAAASGQRSPEDPAAVYSPAMAPEFRERHIHPPIPRLSSPAQSKRLGSTQEDEKCFKAANPARRGYRMWAPNEVDNDGSRRTPLHAQGENQDETCCASTSAPWSPSTSIYSLIDDEEKEEEEEEEEGYECSTPSVLWSGEYKFDRLFPCSWSESQKINNYIPPPGSPCGGREERGSNRRADARREGDLPSKLGPKEIALEEMLPSEYHRHVETLAPTTLGLASRRCSSAASSSTGPYDYDATMLKSRSSWPNSTITTGSGSEICPSPRRAKMGPPHSSCLRWGNHSNIIRGGHHHHHHHPASSTLAGPDFEDTDVSNELFSLSGAGDDGGEAMVSEPETDSGYGPSDGGGEAVNLAVAPSKCGKEKQQNSSSDRSANRDSMGEDEKQKNAEKTLSKKKKRTAKAMTSGQEENATTMMIQNIPRRQTRARLQENLLQSGFRPGVDYDFLYLPISLKIRQNLGYAFINFATSEKAREFTQKWRKKRLAKGRKARALNVTIALVQGKEENWNLLKSDSKARKVAASKLQPVVYDISTYPDVESPEVCQVPSYEDPDAGSIEPCNVAVGDFCAFRH